MMSNIGFWPAKFTITAGINLIESLFDSISRYEKVIRIFFYSSKTFDSASHNKVLNTVDDLNIKNKEYTWLKK